MLKEVGRGCVWHDVESDEGVNRRAGWRSCWPPQDVSNRMMWSSCGMSRYRGRITVSDGNFWCCAWCRSREGRFAGIGCKDEASSTYLGNVCNALRADAAMRHM
jgi:hypothetical protein